MKTLDEARKGWQDLNVEALKKLRAEDEHAPQLQGLRSVVWKECLLFETSDTTRWPQRLSESRSAYNALREHFLRAIHHPDELESAIDPLADNNESPWEALRRDEAIRAEIFQDVERCMPENVYFRQPATQAILLDILFIFFKLNPDVGYRQGMHELLAPVVWVTERDALDTKRWRRADMEDTKDDKLLFDLLDQRYIEHDAFTLFCLIMQNAKAYYESGSGGAKASSIIQAAAVDEAPILAKVHRIYDRLLPRYDPEVSAHLIRLEVVPQVFLMRWMRLLFGREFQFDDTLAIWDQLFASDPSLDLVDYICLAMLLRIRWKLLEADANDALTLLLRYPATFDTSRSSDLVLDALLLKQNRTASAGAGVVGKRTGRPIVLTDEESTRPVTPIGEFPPTMGTPDRRRSPVRSPSRFPTPHNAVNGLEGLLTDAARAAYSRGERWGLNRAMRDAVGDVRKNLAALNRSPSNSLHRRASSTDIIRKVSQLEARNKALAKMLENALSELWECQRQQVEHQGEKMNAKDTSAADALGVAIAKVQFVQVYLNDQTLPLPIEELHPDQPSVAAEKASDQAEQHGARIGDSESIEAALAEAVEPSPARDTQAIEPQEAVQEDASHSVETAAAEASDAARQRARSPLNLPPKPAPAVTATLVPDAPASPPPRPSLEHPSFSFMLGHQSADRQHAFASASPFTDEGSLPSRNRVVGKGFLFGVDEDETAAEGEARSRRGSDVEGRRGKRKVNLLRKKPPTSSGAAKGEGRRDSDADKPAKGGPEEIGLNAWQTAK